MVLISIFGGFDYSRRNFMIKNIFVYVYLFFFFGLFLQLDGINQLKTGHGHDCYWTVSDRPIFGQMTIVMTGKLRKNEQIESESFVCFFSQVSQFL